MTGSLTLAGDWPGASVCDWMIPTRVTPAKVPPTTMPAALNTTGCTVLPPSPPRNLSPTGPPSRPNAHPAARRDPRRAQGKPREGPPGQGHGARPAGRNVPFPHGPVDAHHLQGGSVVQHGAGDRRVVPPGAGDPALV